MARIRTIKPEFWDSPNVAKASPIARLTYIALWTWVDDSGVGTCNEKELEGYIFPNDHIPTLTGNASTTFREVFTEVAECFNMVFYRVNGRPFFFLPNFSKHQRAERKTCGRHPSPEQADDGQKTRDYAAFVGGSDKCAEHFTEDVGTVHGSSALGTGEQGNRGTDNQYLAQPGAVERVRVTRFTEFWDAYPRKVGKKRAQSAYASAARKVGEQTIIDGARRMAADPNLPEARFIPHPTTWLNRGGWDDEPFPASAHRSQDEIVRAMFASATGEHPGLETAPFGLIEDAEVVEP